MSKPICASSVTPPSPNSYFTGPIQFMAIASIGDGQDKVGTRMPSNMMEDQSYNFNTSSTFHAVTQGGLSSQSHGLQGTTSIATPPAWPPQSLHNHSPNGPTLPESPMPNLASAVSGSSTLAAIFRVCC